MQPTTPPPDKTLQSLYITLQRNLEDALRVAGEPRGSKPTRLKGTEIHRRTGLARSTLGNLRKQSPGEKALNPDLGTLCKLADALQIPLPFLLMSPADWRILIKAMRDHGYGLNACDKAGFDATETTHEIARKVLAQSEYENRPPVLAEANRPELARIHAENEALQRCGRVMFSLILQRHGEETDQDERANLIALAANLANHYSKRRSAQEHSS